MRVTSEQQRSLADLSTIDERLRRLRHTRNNLEAQQILDAEQATFDATQDRYGEMIVEQEQAERVNRRLENDIASVTASQKAADAQMYSGALTTEKQVQAVKDEMAAMKKRKFELEEQQLQVMEQLETLERQLATTKADLGQMNQRLAVLTVERDKAAVDIDADIARAQNQRDQVVAEIPEAIMVVYQRTAKGHRGPVVASLQGKTCLGCHMELPGVDIEDLKFGMAQGELVSCPECDTILVPPPPHLP